MKKFVVMVMAMVIALMATMTIGMADTADNQKPKIQMYDLESMSFGDDYDLHISMWVQIPECENAHVEMGFHFTDDASQNYTEGVAKVYDGNTGRLIDETTGWLSADVDCSSKDVETVRHQLLEFAENYDYEQEEGIKYYMISF